MVFQSTVNFNQASGVIGEIMRAGPKRVKPGILASTSAANNVIGRAFRHVATEDLDVTADAAGAFAGILCFPKEYALHGTTSGPLEPTLVLPNGMCVELLSMGTILVDLSQDAPATSSRAIGADIWYQNTTGILVGVVAGTSSVTGYTQVPNAKITYNNIDSDPGLAIITLTN
jgi:hypothetical protein